MVNFLRVPEAELRLYLQHRGTLHPSMLGLPSAEAAEGLVVRLPSGKLGRPAVSQAQVAALPEAIRSGARSCLRSWAQCLKGASPGTAQVQTDLHFPLGDGTVQGATAHVTFYNVCGCRPGNFPLRIAFLRPHTSKHLKGEARLLAAPRPASWAALAAAASSGEGELGRVLQTHDSSSGGSGSTSGNDSSASTTVRRGGAKWSFRLSGGDSGSSQSGEASSRAASSGSGDSTGSGEAARGCVSSVAPRAASSASELPLRRSASHGGPLSMQASAMAAVMSGFAAGLSKQSDSARRGKRGRQADATARGEQHVLGTSAHSRQQQAVDAKRFRHLDDAAIPAQDALGHVEGDLGGEAPVPGHRDCDTSSAGDSGSVGGDVQVEGVL